MSKQNIKYDLQQICTKNGITISYDEEIGLYWFTDGKTNVPVVDEDYNMYPLDVLRYICQEFGIK